MATGSNRCIADTQAEHVDQLHGQMTIIGAPSCLLVSAIFRQAEKPGHGRYLP